jgi:cytochrome c oxidase subunit II
VDVVVAAAITAGLRRVKGRVPGGVGGFVAAACVVVVGLAACGDDGSDAGPDGLSAEGRRGAELANDNGCSGCHGSGAVGPRFEGLYGSTVELDDGSTVVADEAYLTRAITDPGAEIVAGFDVRMPENDLGDDDVAALVAYIRELDDGSSTTGGGG